MGDATNPWSVRGGNHDNNAGAGVFYFSNGIGVNIGSSFRQSKITSKNKIICKVYF